MAPRPLLGLVIVGTMLSAEHTAGAGGAAAAAALRDAANRTKGRDGLGSGVSCAAQSDCPAWQYCDNTHGCYACSYLADPKTKCDALGGDCCSAGYRKQCPSNPMECATCDDALQKTCAGHCHDMQCTFKCASCAGEHQQALHEAGCDNDAIAAWCAGVGPAPPPAAVDHFPCSRIILNNATWSADVNSWARRPPAQVWDLCYSSLTDYHANPAAFHGQCDPHNITVVFARNSIGNVFGGYVRGLSHLLCPFSLSFPVDFLIN